MKLAALLVVLALAACGPSTVETTYNGRKVTEHLNELNVPCGNVPSAVGCYKYMNGEHHIWYPRGNSAARDHERAHVDDMRHTEWHIGPTDSWATVTHADRLGLYKVGTTILVSGNFDGEMIFGPGPKFALIR